MGLFEPQWYATGEFARLVYTTLFSGFMGPKLIKQSPMPIDVTEETVIHRHLIMGHYGERREASDIYTKSL